MAAKQRDRFIDRATAARLVTEEFFGLSKRAIEKWSLPGKMLNGRVHLSERAVRQMAQEKLDSAPATSAPPLRKDR